MADHACPDCGAVHRERPVSLKQRVEMLESKVEMLEARLGPQWSWTMPTFYPTVTDGFSAGTNDIITVND